MAKQQQRSCSVCTVGLYMACHAQACAMLKLMVSLLTEIEGRTVLKQELKTTDFVAMMHTARTYTRILQDIRMVLIHPWAVAELLTCHMLTLLEAVSLVDRFQEYERKLGTHAEWGSDAWLKPVQFEVAFCFLRCNHEEHFIRDKTAPLQLQYMSQFASICYITAKHRIAEQSFLHCQRISSPLDCAIMYAAELSSIEEGLYAC